MMRSFSNDIYLIMIILQYIKDTKLTRIKDREVLNKNSDNYYRAIENMLNHSKHLNDVIIIAIPHIFNMIEYDI